MGLWLDPHAAQRGTEQVFVSHAHSDHIGAHREVIMSAATARLMRARLGGKRVEHTPQFGESCFFQTGGDAFKITLLPAGHILGSSMAFIEAGGDSLLYTGDFKLRSGMSAEPCAPRPAKVLIMETTFGRPAYQFPPAAEVFSGIIRFCREALDNDETPVLLAYSLGKSQELLQGLATAGMPLMLHDKVFDLTRVYEELGQRFPPYAKFDPGGAVGHVLIFPPNANRTALLRGIGKTRCAVVTGWAIDPSCRFRSQVDAAFPLSDHADFTELIEFVRRVDPDKVYTLHGFAADFAWTLRDLGWDAQALSASEQLTLRLDGLASAPIRSRSTES